MTPEDLQVALWHYCREQYGAPMVVPLDELRTVRARSLPAIAYELDIKGRVPPLGTYNPLFDIYVEEFGRMPDAEGLAFWHGEFMAVLRRDIWPAMLAGATPEDRARAMGKGE